MDFIILKSDGSLQKQSLTRYIQQGSHGVDEIFIGWANATSSHILQAVFTLPNKLTNTELGTFVSDYEYEPGETINGWVITLTENQTRYNGLLMVSARIILNGIVQVAYPFALCINETGVRPETDSGVNLEQLDSYLLNIQTLITGAVQQNTDSALSNTSENPVQNKVVKQAIDDAVAGVYKIQGSTYVATLNGLTITEEMNGYVYNMIDSGTLNNSTDTTTVQVGDNVVLVWNEGTWYWDRLSSVFDTSNLVTTDTEQSINGLKTIKRNGTLLQLFKADNSYGYYIEFFNSNGEQGLNFRDSNMNSGQFALRLESYSIVTYAIRPTVDNAYDIGKSDKRYKDLYLSGNAYISGKIDLGGNANIYQQNSNIFLQIANSNAYAFYNAAFVGYGGTRDLGTSSTYWRHLYLAGNMSDGSAFRTVGGLSGKTGTPTVSSNTAELPYDTLSELSLSANTTINLQTAPTGCYPEYKAIITASASITLTFNGVSNFLTNDEDNVVITNGTNTTVALASGTTVEISIVNGKGVAINFGA